MKKVVQNAQGVHCHTCTCNDDLWIMMVDVDVNFANQTSQPSLHTSIQASRTTHGIIGVF